MQGNAHQPIINKNILIVSALFYPEITPRAFRATELARELARQGHKVTVLIPDSNFNYVSFEQESGISVKLMKIKWRPEWNKKKYPWILNIVKRAIARFLEYFFQYPYSKLSWAIPEALQNTEPFDLLVSVAYPFPVHWGCARARQKNPLLAKKWVADCGDPFMGNKTTLKPPFYFSYIEKWFCRIADYITIPIEEAKSGYYPEFHQKIKIIPQGFNFSDTDYSLLYTPNKVPTFAYAGGFIPGKRDPRPFLDYLVSLNKPYCFQIYTAQPGLVMPWVERSSGKIELYPYIPRDELLLKMAKADFLVNFDNNTAVHSPSKLIDYALVKRPVLNITSSFDPKQINAFLDGNYDGQLIAGDLSRYDIRLVASQFIELCK